MILDKLRIKHKIGALSEKLSINVYKKIGSTNTQAKLHAAYGRCGNSVFIASEQTAGRGRLGRSFVSNKNKGLYLSILLNEKLPPELATSLTTYMAVIASRAIHSLSGAEPKIKWVNDLYLGGKKCAGILTEARASESGNALDYAVVGIGINLFSQDFPEEVKDIATTLEDECGRKVKRCDLAALIVKEFFDNLHLVGAREIAEEYKSRSFLIGERVTVIKPTVEYAATVKDITDKCELLLTLDGGKEELLSTGEVSLRLAK
ncbi:MAG: biotin--[Clostridia bacterium]|nr:biotin--[acetyl-CoA-carboxylase] ligase [Clostridia bacterium]